MTQADLLIKLEWFIEPDFGILGNNFTNISLFLLFILLCLIALIWFLVRSFRLADYQNSAIQELVNSEQLPDIEFLRQVNATLKKVIKTEFGNKQAALVGKPWSTFVNKLCKFNLFYHHNAEIFLEIYQKEIFPKQPINRAEIIALAIRFIKHHKKNL